MNRLRKRISKLTALIIALAMMVTLIPVSVSAAGDTYGSEGQGCRTSIAMKDSASVDVDDITTDNSIDTYFANSILTKLDASETLKFKFLITGPGTSDASEEIIKQTALPYINIYEQDDAITQTDPKAAYNSGNGNLKLENIEKFGTQPLITISIPADTLLPGSEYALVFDSGLSVGKENSEDVLGKDVIFFFTTKQQDGPLVLEKTNLSLSIGECFRITASTDGKAVIAEWTSDNPDIVSVDNGNVRAIAEGKAVITARYEGESAVCIVKVAGVEYGMQGSTDNQFVMKEPSDVCVLAETEDYFLNRINTRFAVDEDIGFLVQLSGGLNSFKEDEFKAKNLPLIKIYNEDRKEIIAQSSPDENQYELEYAGFEAAKGINLKISNGLPIGKYCLVVGKDLEGNSPGKIIGKDIIFQFRVADPNEQVPVENLSLDREKVTVSKGAELKLNPTIEPYDATNKNITWTSSNETVASVDNSIVTALSSGTTEITAVSESGNIEVTCEVKVVESSITLSHLTLEMKIGQEEQLKAYDNAGARIYPLFSSDVDEIVSVDKNGNLKGISAGNATVTAQYGEETVLCVITVASSGKYMAQGISGNMLTMLSPSSIYLKEYIKDGDTNYFHNVINTALDGSKEIVFGFTMSAGVNNFNNQDSFLKNNMPNIKICDKYQGKVLAQYQNSEGKPELKLAGFDEATKTIYISLPAKVLKNGTYSLVFDKTLCGNNTNKNIGCDIFFDFEVLCSIENMEVTLSETSSLEAEITALKDEEQSFGEIKSLTIKTVPDAKVTAGDFKFIRENLCKNLKSLDITEAALENNALPEGALAGCTALENIQMPTALKTISAKAFAGCSSLNRILHMNAADPPVIEDESAFENTNIDTIRVQSESASKYKNADIWKNYNIEVMVSGISLDKDTVTLPARTTTNVTLSFTPEDAADKTVTWTSDDESIAVVKDGEITGIQEGETTVFARSNDGGFIATCKVIVDKPIYNHTIVLNRTSSILYTAAANNTVQLMAELENPDGLDAADIQWASSNESVAVVENGLVTGKSEGTADIIASLEGKYAICRVNVRNHTIGIDRGAASIYSDGPGRTVTIKAAVDGSWVLGSSVKWTSSNTAVATVSNGVVYGRAPGITTITALANDRTVSCRVSVNAPILKLDRSTVTIYTKGYKSVLLTPYVNGGKASGNSVSWSISSTKYASVSKSGVVTAKKKGTIYVTAKAYGKSVKCKVVIKDPSLKLKKSSATIKKGKTVKITATATPSGKITYSSKKKSIATVTSKGVVKGKKKGTTYIFVKCNGVTKTFKVKVK